MGIHRQDSGGSGLLQITHSALGLFPGNLKHLGGKVLILERKNILALSSVPTLIVPIVDLEIMENGFAQSKLRWIFRKLLWQAGELRRSAFPPTNKASIKALGLADGSPQ